MSSGTRLVRYSAAKALQQILEADESDDVDSSSNDSSGSDYEDHISETSEHNDITSDDQTGLESAQDSRHAQDMQPGTNRAMNTTGRGRSRGRGRGRGRGLRRGGALSSSTPMHQPNDEDVLVSAAPSDAPFVGKNGFVWDRQPPPTGRRRTQDIIRTMPGVTSVSRCSTILETMQLYLTAEIINNVVLQTNREANRRIREWNEKNTDKEKRGAWKPVTDNEILAFCGLCMLAGVYRSNHEPQASLWSAREGRPPFIATMSRGRFRDIMKYIRFDDEVNSRTKVEGRQVSRFPRHLDNVHISASQVFCSWARSVCGRATGCISW